MQKIIFRPICHLSFQQANTIYEEVRSSQASYGQQGSVMQRPFEQSPFSNSTVTANNHMHFANNPNQKNNQQNLRGNRLTSLPESNQYPPNNPNSHYSPQLPHNIQMPPADNKGSQKIISKDSIIRKYDDFFGQKVNSQALKEQNSRLYYEKLALQASVQKLKEQNIKKDTEISRLKEIIETTKNTSNQTPKLMPGFQSQLVNQPSPQVHFRSTFEQKRPF